QDILDFLRRNLHPTRIDHECGTIREIDVAVAIQVSKITNCLPASVVPRAISFGWILVVTKGARAFHPDRTRHPGWHLVSSFIQDMEDARGGAPDRPLLGEPLLSGN